MSLASVQDITEERAALEAGQSFVGFLEKKLRERRGLPVEHFAWVAFDKDDRPVAVYPTKKEAELYFSLIAKYPVRKIAYRFVEE